jgi:L-threonylcarbamoyladenylate synthase
MTDSTDDETDTNDDRTADGSDHDESDLDRAAAAIDRGEALVYPTETVYGLGADALDAEAVSQAFSLKGRSHKRPISFAVASVDEASEYARPTAREKRFMEEFLPGPVTVLLERRGAIPNVLTAGREKVGVRVPDHDLARELCRRCGPLTATSANRSGEPSARRTEELDETVRENVAVVLDGGRTPGTESTVVDVASRDVIRRGANAEAIDRWLTEH